MTFLKWFGYILVCLDTLTYILERAGDTKKSSAGFVGAIVGAAARLYVLYNTAVYWLLV